MISDFFLSVLLFYNFAQKILTYLSIVGMVSKRVGKYEIGHTLGEVSNVNIR